ncbi:hypothetical protein Hanom_Chr10g00915831 [Helianthus anomalus]
MSRRGGNPAGKSSGKTSTNSSNNGTIHSGMSTSSATGFPIKIKTLSASSNSS